MFLSIETPDNKVGFKFNETIKNLLKTMLREMDRGADLMKNK